MSAYLRLKGFVHWMKAEKDASEDRLMYANDIQKLLVVVDAAKSYEILLDYGEKLDQFSARKKLRRLIEELEIEK